MKYEIVTRDKDKPRPYDWRDDGIGAQGNSFAAIEDARDAIGSLLDLGDEWAEPVYGIQAIGEGVVLEHWQTGRHTSGSYPSDDMTRTS